MYSPLYQELVHRLVEAQMIQGDMTGPPPPTPPPPQQARRILDDEIVMDEEVAAHLAARLWHPRPSVTSSADHIEELISQPQPTEIEEEDDDAMEWRLEQEFMTALIMTEEEFRVAFEEPPEEEGKEEEEEGQALHQASEPDEQAQSLLGRRRRSEGPMEDGNDQGPKRARRG